MPNIDAAIAMMRNRLGANGGALGQGGGMQPAPTMTDEMPAMNVPPMVGPRGAGQDLSGVQTRAGQAGIVGRGGNFQPLGAAAQQRQSMARSQPQPLTTRLSPDGVNTQYLNPDGSVGGTTQIGVMPGGPGQLSGYLDAIRGQHFPGPSGGIYGGTAENPGGAGGGITSFDPSTRVPNPLPGSPGDPNTYMRDAQGNITGGTQIGWGQRPGSTSLGPMASTGDGPGTNLGGMMPPVLSPAEQGAGQALTDIAVARPQVQPAVGIGGAGGPAGGAPKPGAPGLPPMGADGTAVSKPAMMPPAMPSADNKLRAARRPVGGAMQRRRQVNQRMGGVLTQYGGLK